MSASVESNPLRRKAVSQLILATAAWGISFPLFKMLFDVQKAHVPGVDTFFLAAHAIAFRALGAAAFFLILWPRLLCGLTRKEWRQGLLLGFFGGAGLIFQADGMNYTSASTSAFLTQFYCVLLPLWACMRRRAWLPFRLLVATLLVLGGISILSGLVEVEPSLRIRSFSLDRGAVETLIAAGFFTVQILLLERPAWKANRMIPVTVLMFFGWVVWSLPVILISMPSWSAVAGVYQNHRDFLIMGAVVLFCTVYAYTAMNRWQPHVTATEGGLIYCLEPVFTALYTLFLPGLLAVWTGVPYANEVLTPATLIGGGLITAANIILQLPRRRPKT